MSRPEFLPLSSPAPRVAVPLRRPTVAEAAPLPGRASGGGVPLSRNPGVESEAERVREAARQFEALFLSYLYKTMRETVPDSPFGEGQGSAMYEEMFTPSVGESMTTAGGIGLADLMVKHFESGGARGTAEALRNARGGNAGSTGVTEAGGGSVPLPPEGGPPRRSAPAFRAAPADRTAVETSRIGGKEIPGLADNVRQALDRAAEQTGVDRNLLQAVIVVESGGNPNAESRRGARGLMQLMAGTAKELGVKDAFDPIENVLAGARYLKRMLVTHGGDERLALAAYNAGPGNVRRHGGVPPFRETHNYIERVLDIRNRLGGPVA